MLFKKKKKKKGLKKRVYKPKLDENGKPIKKTWDPTWGSPVVTFRLREEVLERLNKMAKVYGLPRSAMIAALIEKYLRWEEVKQEQEEQGL